MKQIISFLILLNCLRCSNQPLKTTSGLEGENIPFVDLILQDSISHINTGNIAIGKQNVLICYSPYCPYCLAEIEDILANITFFKKINIYLITPLSFSDMKEFYDKYNLNKYSNIITGQDYKNIFLSHFKATGIPYTAVYDSNNKLKKLLIGKSDAQTIKDIILE